jgi:hypothetical protein
LARIITCPLSLPDIYKATYYLPSSLCHTSEDGTDIGYRNVGRKNSDAGEIPKRIYIIKKIVPVES